MAPTEPANVPTGLRLTARLPKSTHNGLADIVGDLIADPNHIRTAVIAYDSPRTIKDNDDGTVTAVVRITRIEPLAGRGERAGQKLLAEAATARTGDTLPLGEWEDWAGRDTEPDDADGTDGE